MRIPPTTTTEVAPVPQRSEVRRYRRLTLLFPFRSSVEPRPISLSLGAARVVLGREPGFGGFQVDDARASRQHAEVIYVSADDSFRVRDLGSRNGTFLDGQRVESARLWPGSVLRVGDSLFSYSAAAIPPGLDVPDRASFGVSIATSIVNAAADLAAPTCLPMLIVGPTGSGKEVLARRIHERSGRKGPFVAVNCSTFARELIGSELFGHMAGAFSGAHESRQGLFLSANEGTLFLDEVAELPVEQQPALLRVLQEAKVRPVGSDKEIDIDVRVISATLRSIQGSCDSGPVFREDLYARLAGMVIDLPGLSARPEEILPLFHQFIGSDVPPLSVAAAEALLVYEWPRNVRELIHAAQRTKLFCQGQDTIERSALPPEITKAQEAPQRRQGEGASLDVDSKIDTDLPGQEELELLLRKHEGNVAGVARATGRHRQQVYRWLRRYGIEANAYRVV